MPARIVLAPVGAGKTEIALRQLVETLDERPFARVWALLASKRQEDAFRQRLVEYRADRKIYFNVEFFNFYELYRRLLDGVGQPQRLLNDTARYGVLRTVVDELNSSGLLDVFRPIAHTPGFLRVVADFIYELKQLRVYPNDFLASGRTRRDTELALIYQQYQDRLQAYHLVDKEGEGWLAVNALLEDVRLADDLSLLLVDGFDQFTLVQADLLALLAGRATETLITLTTVPQREDRAGRRFQQTLARLRGRFPERSLEEVWVEMADDGRHPDLHHLIGQVFMPGAKAKPSEGGIHLIEAPDPAAEAAAVLREVKRLLLNGGAPDDILIALRDWSRYEGHLAAYGRAYGLPLVPHYGESLAQNPAVDAVLNLLALHERDFRRRDLLDVMRSPYFAVPGMTDARLTLLEKISLDQKVVGGRTTWVEAIEQAAKLSELREDDRGDELALATLQADEASELQADLAAFMDAVTPPPLATVAEYIHWLEMLIGRDPDAKTHDELPLEEFEIEQGGYTLDMLARLRDDSAGAALVTRDLAAMQAFKQVLRGLLSARALLRSLEEQRALDDAPEDSPVMWETFKADLLAAVNSAGVDARPNRSGRVLVTTASDARGLPHDHVFILGLSEGVFPRRVGEDPLYLDTERLAFRDRGIPLQTQAESANDDALFYELICLPRHTLTLSRPTVEEGKRWIASHLWRAAAAVFADSESLIASKRLRVGQCVPAEQAAALNEAVLGVVDGLSAGAHEVQGVYNWLCVDSAWGRVRDGRRIEDGRMSPQPYDHYSGRLVTAALIDQVTGRFASGHAWSASQLNDFGVCGYRYFARRLLRLEALEEPEEGMDAAQRGTLNHEILQRTYQHFIDEGLTLTPENLDHALQTLHEVAADVFRNAPRRLGFRATALWKQEQQVLLRKLEALVRADFSVDSPVLKKFKHGTRVPYQLEAPFGLDGGPEVVIDLGDGQSVRVRGYIDRIDRLNDSAVVIDYKTGSTGISVNEIVEGRNFQMMVYVLAVKTLLARKAGAPRDVAGGLFWHVSSGKASGVLELDGDGQAAIEQGKAHIARMLERGRAGDFSAEVNKAQDGKCVRYCEFGKMCRMSVMHRRKRG
ncbi:MAG: PD-(D/E)XK nuclease family protein [bacterium]|nr:PD-(D/E)XK nuclease family protein [bacterium]